QLSVVYADVHLKRSCELAGRGDGISADGITTTRHYAQGEISRVSIVGVINFELTQLNGYRFALLYFEWTGSPGNYRLVIYRAHGGLEHIWVAASRTIVDGYANL